MYRISVGLSSNGVGFSSIVIICVSKLMIFLMSLNVIIVYLFIIINNNKKTLSKYTSGQTQQRSNA